MFEVELAGIQCNTIKNCQKVRFVLTERRLSFRIEAKGMIPGRFLLLLITVIVWAFSLELESICFSVLEFVLVSKIGKSIDFFSFN